MKEKRQFTRFKCKIKTDFEYYTGNPESEIKTEKMQKGTGFITDLSQGGAFIITDEKVTIGNNITLHFKDKKKLHEEVGKIIRTGSIHNNPSEIAKKLKSYKIKGEQYIAVAFESPLASLNSTDLD